MVTRIEDLKNTYLATLSEMVEYGGRTRPRVRHIGNWERLTCPTEQNIANLSACDPHSVWIWSDLHFGHNNIIEFSNRPYMNTDEMNEDLVFRFNEYVNPEDTSIWVGDVSFMKDGPTSDILDRFNGDKILIVGNHDFKGKHPKQMTQFKEQYMFHVYENDTVQLMFTHYPITNNILPWPWINVHGHIHVDITNSNSNFLTDQHINVNCEFHQYKPITLAQIIKWATMRIESHDK